MNILQLRDTLRQAEQAYNKAKTSLDGSNELVLAKQALKEARFNFNLACREYVLKNLFNE